MTEQRIYDWIDTYGRDGVSISFSGGKDSTVLMDIVRNQMGYKDIQAVFVDVPTQLPELKEFALTWDNVEVIYPKKSFIQVCKEYGFPLISKEVSENVYGARKYLTSILEQNSLERTNERTNERTKPRYGYWYARITGTGAYQRKAPVPLRDKQDPWNVSTDQHLPECQGGVRQKVSQNPRNWRICSTVA